MTSPVHFRHGGAYHMSPDGQGVPEDAELLPRAPEDGEAWDGNAFVFDGTPLVAAAHSSIDAQAEHARSLIITPGPGQAMTYLQKTAEARAWLADDTMPTLILSAEAEAMDMPLADLAAEVVANADAWLVIGGRIEGARRAAKRAASEATDAAGIRAATNINWQDVINGN